MFLRFAWHIGDHIPCESAAFHESNDGEIDIYFPPAVAVSGQSLMSMVVVVPALSVGQQSHPPEIAAVSVVSSAFRVLPVRPAQAARRGRRPGFSSMRNSRAIFSNVSKAMG